MSEWQPITTFPPSESIESRSPGEQFFLVWDASDREYHLATSWGDMSLLVNASYDEIAGTHWMPLPEPPA